MAKGKKKENQYQFESDNDDLNFDDFDVDAMDVGTQPNDDRSVVTGTAKAFGSGVMDELIGRDKVFANIKRLGMGVAPDDIRYATSDVGNLYETTAESFRKAKGIIKPAVVKTAKTIKSLVPAQLKIIHERLDGFIESNDESKLQRESEAAQLESSITSNISSIFDKQIAVQMQTEAVNKAEKAFDDHQQTERYKTNINILSSIEQGITQLSSYNLQINREYQKKSLELQFRSFYTQVETLKTIKTYFELFKTQNEAISKNTSLPDYVKIKATEKMIDVSREKLFGSMYDRLYSKGSFLSKVKQKIENKIVGTAKDIRFGMDSALDGYDMMASMNQGPMHTMIGSMAGGMFSGSMLDKLEMKLREKYGSKIANLKSVKGINNAAKMFNNDPALLLSNISSGFGKQRDKLDNVQYDPTKGFLKKGMAKLGSSLFGGLEDMTRFRGTNTLNTEIKGDSMASAESPAIFDKKTQRSIIDVIPMYLARILQQTTRVATHFGAPEVGLLKYDYNARLLVTDTKAKEKLTKSVRSFLTRGEGNSKRDTLGLLDNQMTDNDKDGLIEYLDRSGADINSAEDLTKALSRDDIPPALKEAAASVKRKLERISKKDRNNYDNRINATFNTGKKLDELIRKLMLLGTTYGSSKKEVESLKIIFTIHIMTGGELKLSQLKDLVQKLPTHVASNMRILKFIKSLYGDVETQADAAVTLSYISKILKNETISNPDALLRLIDDLGFESRDSMIEAGIMTRDDDTDDLKVNAPMIVSLLLGTDATDVNELTENNRSEITRNVMERINTAGSALSREDFKEDVSSLKNLAKLAVFDGTKGSALGIRSGWRAAKSVTTRYFQAGRSKKILKTIGGDVDALYQEARAKALAKSPEALEAFDRVFKKAEDFKTLITESSTFKGLSSESLHFYSQRSEDLKKIKDVLKGTKAGTELTKVLGSVYKQANSVFKNTRTMVGKFLEDSEVMEWVKASSEELWLKLTNGTDGQVKLDTLTQEEFEQIVGILRDNGLNLTQQAYAAFKREFSKKTREGLKKAKELAKTAGAKIKETGATSESRGNFFGNIKNRVTSLAGDIKNRFNFESDLTKKEEQSGKSKEEINQLIKDGRDSTELYRSIEQVASQNKGTPIREIEELKDVPEEVLSAFDNLVKNDKKLQERLDNKDAKTDDKSKEKSSSKLKRILGKVGVGGGGLLAMIAGGSAMAGETTSGAAAAGTLLSGISLVDMGITAALVGVGVFGTRKLVSHLKNNKTVVKKFKDLQSNLTNFTTGLRDSIVNTVKNTLNATKKMFTNVLGKSKDIYGSIKSKVGGFKDNLFNFFKPKDRGAEALDKADEHEKNRTKEQEDELNTAKSRNQKNGTPAGGIFGGMLDGIKKMAGALALGVVPLLGKIATGIGGVITGVKNLLKPLSFLGPILKGAGKAAKFVGTKILAPAATWLARGGASLIASTLVRMTPIGLLATAAWGAYKVFDLLTRNNAGEATRIRLRQYGLKEEDKSIYHLIFGLEEFLKKKVVKDQHNFSLKSLERDEMVEIFEKFEVDFEKPESKPQADMFANWMNKRFIPVFLEHKRALEAVKSGIELTDIDKLKPDELLKYIDQLHVKPSVYNLKAGINYKLPSITITKEEIIEYIKTVREKAKKSVIETIDKDVATIAKKEPLKKETRKKTHTGFCPDGSYSASGYCDESKSAKPPTINGTPPVPPAGEGSKPSYEPAKPLSIPTPSDNSKGEDGGSPGLTGVSINSPKIDEGKLAKAKGTLVKGTPNGKYVRLSNGVKLEGVNPRMQELLFGMIEEYGQLTGKQVTITDGFRTKEDQARMKAKYGDRAAKPGTSMHEFGLAVDINGPDADALEKLGLMRKYGFTRPVGHERWHVESALVSTKVAESKKNKELATDLIDKSIGLGGGGYGTDPNANKYGRNPSVQMAAAKADLSQDVDQSTMVNIDKPSGIKAFADPNTVKSDYPRSTSTPVDTINELNAAATKSNATTYSAINATNPYTKDAEQALNVTGSKSDMLKIIDQAADKVGVPREHLRAFAMIESSLNASIKNPGKGQSATGLFQFTGGTWEWVINKYGKKYGYDLNTPRTDPMANAIMGAHYYQFNSKQFGSTDPVDVYIGHHYGPGGGKRVLDAIRNNPNMSMQSVLTAGEYSANKNEIGNRTAGEYYAYLQDKMNKNIALTKDKTAPVTKNGIAFNDHMKDIKNSSPVTKNGIAFNDHMKGIKNSNINTAMPTEPNPIPEPKMAEAAPPSSQPNSGFIKTSATMNTGAPSPDVVSTMKHNANVTNQQMDSSIEVLNEQLKTQKDILGALIGIAKLISPEVIKSYMQTSPDMTTNSINLNRQVPA